MPKKPHLIRVGFCACTAAQYAQGLEGHRFPIRFQGRSLVVNEVTLPRVNEDPAIRRARCHFYVDVHKRKKLFQHLLVFNIFVPTKRGERFIFGGDNEHFHLSLIHTVPQRLSVSEILEWMERVLLKLRERGELDAYLVSMTPPTWQFPQPKARACAR